MSSTQAVTAFVNFPSPYTQNLLVKALVSTLDSIAISLVPPSDEDPPRLQWYVLSFLALWQHVCAQSSLRIESLGHLHTGRLIQQGRL